MNDLQRINYVNVSKSIPIILSKLCMHILRLLDCYVFALTPFYLLNMLNHSGQSPTLQATDGFITAVSPLLHIRLTALSQRSVPYFTGDWRLYHSGQSSTSQETDGFITAVSPLLHIRLTALSQRSVLYFTRDWRFSNKHLTVSR